MKKRILLFTAAFVAVAVGVVGMSAYEAHVINVTAQIENALAVSPLGIEFGTVFPEESLVEQITIAMSESFGGEGDVDDINYVIKQKPKCWNRSDGYAQVLHDAGVFSCPPDYEIMNSLCPFLSKHDADSDDYNDGEGINAFHGSLAWTYTDSENNKVVGRLAKSQQDFVDLWDIDLVVPCFIGMCAQDNVVPEEYQLDPILNGEMFGCDLWIEVTEISRAPEPNPDNKILSLENKDEDGWFVLTDEVHGVLEFNPCGDPFTFTLTANGLQTNTNYSLIYYADGWPGNHPGALIWSGDSDSSGDIGVSSSISLGINLPDLADANYSDGAKIWLVPSRDYDATSKSMTAWNPDDYLYEYNLINWLKICPQP